MFDILLIILILACLSFWIGKHGPSWSIAFLIFLPLQVFGLALPAQPSISQDISWLQPIPITIITSLILIATVQFCLLKLPFAGILLPKKKISLKRKYPAFFFVTPSFFLAFLSFFSLDNTFAAVFFYGVTYLALAILVAGFLELPKKKYDINTKISLCTQVFLVLFALANSSNGQLVFALTRFSTPIIAAFVTLVLHKKKTVDRGFFAASFIVFISLMSVTLINFSLEGDNLVVLINSAYRSDTSESENTSYIVTLLSIAGKLVARQDFNDMLRSFSKVDYQKLLNFLDSNLYPFDTLLRLVGMRGYDHPIGQILFFLQDKSRSVDLYPSSNVPIGFIAVILSRQSILQLLFVSFIYATLFSTFLEINHKKISEYNDGLQTILVALSGEFMCLFELTPEFGLQVATMTILFFWFWFTIYHFFSYLFLKHHSQSF